MELSEQQQVRVAVVYFSALAPLVLLVGLWLAGRLATWVAAAYALSFAACAIG